MLPPVRAAWDGAWRNTEVLVVLDFERGLEAEFPSRTGGVGCCLHAVMASFLFETFSTAL